MTPKLLSHQPLIDPTAELTDCTLGRYTEVGPRTKLLEVAMADYSYVVNDSDIAYATIGKFCSIAAMTRINPGNHPMWRASQSHFTYRASSYFPGEADEPGSSEGAGVACGAVAAGDGFAGDCEPCVGGEAMLVGVGVGVAERAVG